MYRFLGTNWWVACLQVKVKQFVEMGLVLLFDIKRTRILLIYSGTLHCVLFIPPCEKHEDL